MAPTFTLPDFAAEWPFKRTQNPHYKESLCIANAEWMKSLNLLQVEKQISFDACNLPLFASLVYPRVNPLLLRLSLDFLEWTFFLDELCDQSDSTSEYQKLTSDVMDVLWSVKYIVFLSLFSWLDIC
jgi:hypothetical protein